MQIQFEQLLNLPDIQFLNVEITEHEIDFRTRSIAIPLTRKYDSLFLWFSYGFPMRVKYVPSITCNQIHSHVAGNIRLEMFDSVEHSIPNDGRCWLN